LIVEDAIGGGFVFVSFAWFTVTFPSAVARPVVTVSGSVLAGDFRDWMSTSPNKGAAPNRRLRFGLAPWSPGFFMSQGSAVGELTLAVIHAP